MKFIKCSKCDREIESNIMVNLNGKDFCPNCISLYVCWNESELPKNNILIDGEDTMELTRDLIVRLIRKNLTKRQYHKLKKLYPNNWYLHDDFYDEEGNKLQPF